MRETAHRACQRLTVALVAATTLGIGATASAADSLSAPATAPDSGALTGSPATDEAIASASASRLAWQTARETDAARASREHSRSAYRNLPDAEALATIRDAYPRLLSEPLWEPPPLGPGERITGFSDPLTAKIAGPDGTEATIHSATPIRSALGSGEPALVDIGLSDGPSGTYVPANPLVAYSLPGNLAEGIRFDDGALGVRFPDASAAAVQKADEKLVALNAWADTDIVLSPLPEGFSTTQVLRSPASPESYRVDLELPAGAELRDVGGEGDPAGAIVELAGGEGRLSITSPVAFDADGVAVETSLRVADADSLELGIAHREEDLRYPLQLDPTYAFCHGGCANYWNEWSNWTPNYGNWGFHSGDFFGTYGLAIYPHWETSHPDWYGLGEYAYWQWQGAFFRDENLYRYFSGDLSGGGYNAWAVHGVQDPPSARWITGVARVNHDDYDTHSPWAPYATLGGHTNWNIDHCFIGESPTSCNLAALADNHPDLTGRRPTMQASWVTSASYGVETYVFMRYAYAYTTIPGPPEKEVPCTIAASVPVQARDMITDVGVAAEKPPSGTGVNAQAMTVAGVQELTVNRDAQGTLSVEDCGPETIEDPEPSSPPNPPQNPTEPGADPNEDRVPTAARRCNDRAFELGGWHWTQTYNWQFNRGSTPPDLDPNAAENHLIQGTQAITNLHNDCGEGDNISATQSYGFDTNRSVDLKGVHAEGKDVKPGCKKFNNRDGTSVTDFGDLPSDYLGWTCTWWLIDGGPNTAVESDMRLNDIDAFWTTDPGSPDCTKGWSVRGVTAHERGHTYGLKHVSERDHGNLTMSRLINEPCRESEYTLGLGDILGLRQRY